MRLLLKHSNTTMRREAHKKHHVSLQGRADEFSVRQQMQLELTLHVLHLMVKLQALTEMLAGMVIHKEPLQKTGKILTQFSRTKKKSLKLSTTSLTKYATLPSFKTCMNPPSLRDSRQPNRAKL